MFQNITVFYFLSNKCTLVEQKRLLLKTLKIVPIQNFSFILLHVLYG